MPVGAAEMPQEALDAFLAAAEAHGVDFVSIYVHRHPHNRRAYQAPVGRFRTMHVALLGDVMQRSGHANCKICLPILWTAW